MQTIKGKFQIFLSLGLLCSACTGDDEALPDGAVTTADAGLTSDAEVANPDAQTAAALEIAGTWESNWGGLETIDQSMWGVASVLSFSNDGNYLLTQNPADAKYSPSKFNKIVWTEPTDGKFYYCLVDFGLDTEQEAMDTMNIADETDPGTSGCGGFSWTWLATPIEIRGDWTSSFGGTESITSFTWGGKRIDSSDDEANYAITQNPSDAEYSPDKYNKLVWTDMDADSFYYCTVDFGLDTAAEAVASTNTADDADPDNSGCGGFSWTKLSAVQ